MYRGIGKTTVNLLQT